MPSLRRRGVFFVDQVLSRGDEVVKHILLLQLGAGHRAISRRTRRRRACLPTPRSRPVRAERSAAR